MIRLVPFLFLIFISGCDREPEIHRGTILAFGTAIDVTLADVSAHKAIKARRELIRMFDAMHSDWHAWRPGRLAHINASIPQGEFVAAEEDILYLISLAQQLETQSDGLFNPAIGKLIALWGFHRDDPENASAPDKEQIDKLMIAQPSMLDIEIKDKRLKSSNPTVQIDMGGYAKGYGIDQALETLKAMNIDNAILNAGGDLRVIGQHSERPWRVGLKNPRGDGIIATVDIHDGEAIFTSGDYERNHGENDKHNHHIINPKTGYPSTGAVSATVIHNNGAIADAAATALMIAGKSDWHRIAQQMDIKFALIIDESGNLHMNPAMAKRIQLEPTSTLEIVISPPFISRPLDTP